jgi:hypothetical protein
MADIELSQSEADRLMQMAKVKMDDNEYRYPGIGGSLIVPLTSQDKRENFLLDISRGRIEIRRGKYQLRGHQVIILARLDFGGPPHRNPNGEELPCPHLHLYREDYGDKWAYPVPSASFPNLDNLWQTLHDFMDYCHVVEPPMIVRGMFV